MMDLFNILFENDALTVEQAAILTALTKNREREDAIKALLSQKGFQVVATTISGEDSVVRKKVIASVVGACLNANLIEKNKKNIHAVIHATHEACVSGKLGSVINQNYQLKAAIARNADWISICLYGDLAMHEFSNHKTISIGVMHI